MKIVLTEIYLGVLVNVLLTSNSGMMTAIFWQLVTLH